MGKGASSRARKAVELAAGGSIPANRISQTGGNPAVTSKQKPSRVGGPAPVSSDKTGPIHASQPPKKLDGKVKSTSKTGVVKKMNKLHKKPNIA